MPAGRPSEYSPERGDEICGRLAKGESLNSICKSENMPALPTVYRWMRQREEFRNNYASAREDQADTLADEILYIADTPVSGIKTKTNSAGEVETTESDMIEHRRLQVDARKWIAAKLKPKKYGDAQAMQINLVPIAVQISFAPPDAPLIEHDKHNLPA
jgi:hypothetical protein